jgi:hypothetical protein
MRQLIFAAPLLLSLLNLCPVPCFAQSESTNVGISRVGIGVKISTLGPGIEAAYELSPRLNVRGGFNDFSYGVNSTNNGIRYNGTLTLRSAQASLDWFFWHSLHLSPGLVFYNGNRASATASAIGQSFTLNNITYLSNPATPITGTGTVKFSRVGPSIMFGVGNLVPRGHRFSISFEIGGVYQGSPNVTLNLTGSACDPTGTNCRNVATDPGIQSNVQAQQTKYNSDISRFKFWPVISLGFGFKL